MSFLHTYYNFYLNPYIVFSYNKNMNTSILKNQQYQTCVDACNNCAECCELVVQNVCQIQRWQE